MKPKTRKKIAVIGLKGLPAAGGAATVGENIIRELYAEYDFTILSISSHANSSYQSDWYKQVVFRSFGSGGVNTLIYYINCLVHCLFRNYDLIHLHHGESGFITPLLRLKYRTIVTLHGVLVKDDPKFSRFHNLFFRFSERTNIKLANVVVSVSRPDAVYATKKYGRKIEYIPNNVQIHSTIKRESVNVKDHVLFAAGRIYQIKGLDILLNALRQMDRKIKCLVAGNLDQVHTYRNEILELAKEQDVTFTGMITNKEELLQTLAAARIFVFPSLTEAMSIMLLEAVSVKVPVIASDIPSNKEIFDDDEVLFFRSGDISDLQRKISFALENSSKMEQMAEKAFGRLSSEYTGQIVGKQYKQIYERLLN